MKFNKVFFLAIVFIVMVWSCKKDDDGIVYEPPKALSEIVNLDNDSIVKYMETHFYNYEEFANPPAGFDYRIVLGKIEGDNADKTPLSEMMQSETVTVRSREIGLDNDKEVEHTYYYLVAREGAGESPTVADATYIRYEGLLLNGTIFDASTVNPIWLEYTNRIRGFSVGTQHFKAGDNIIVNNDGTYEIENYGVGLIIFPSALGYYSGTAGSIPSYSPLIFKIDLMTVDEADHDNDGVPSYREDLNGNGYLADDNTDLKSEEKIQTTLVPNFLDNDDDNDGRLTRDEISDADGNIVFPYPDSNNDGTPDYLDPNY
ncbi:hypothetical protein MWU65_15200 [Cellulophaga sp. F20128]|uniref:FKBP-type peptidyl-prolyl cis-trans isomerase n=1 Tax=Cellulophaga sp. F20128 TaxID=2926413 RepID=UPI001FF6F4C9|nr:FKBP-type peptidyl-prolyl cis-trans isomerase [Cellulophaga sp. F20128]MCK0158541.1 hypothetical protein [Cellulophaga sp. F20128]